MKEITLLEAMQQLWEYDYKEEPLVFQVTFDDGITRTAKFGKVWSRVRGEWQYAVQDGEHAPCFAYNERAAVSAIMRISGMELRGNIVKYHIYQKK